MKHVRWKVLMHCADCADKLRMFIGAFQGVESCKAIIPEDKEDATQFEGHMEFTYDASLVSEEQIRKEAADEGFEILETKEN